MNQDTLPPESSKKEETADRPWTLFAVSSHQTLSILTLTALFSSKFSVRRDHSYRENTSPISSVHLRDYCYRL